MDAPWSRSCENTPGCKCQQRWRGKKKKSIKELLVLFLNPVAQSSLSSFPNIHPVSLLALVTPHVSQQIFTTAQRNWCLPISSLFPEYGLKQELALETRTSLDTLMEKCDVPNKTCGPDAVQSQVRSSPLTAKYPHPQVRQDLQEKLPCKQTAWNRLRLAVTIYYALKTEAVTACRIGCGHSFQRNCSNFNSLGLVSLKADPMAFTPDLHFLFPKLSLEKSIDWHVHRAQQSSRATRAQYYPSMVGQQLSTSCSTQKRLEKTVSPAPFLFSNGAGIC